VRAGEDSCEDVGFETVAEGVAGLERLRHVGMHERRVVESGEVGAA
jgi:hypothetical protein